MNEKVFRDPVHNYIHVNNQIIYDLINTKEFQRLRRIKQLGTSSYTFHGGEHSRFSHCLGVYEIARRITEIFEEKYPEEWNPAESLLTMTAALLHDLGHGAYSHTFENLFDTDHEAITQEIIQNPETEIHQVLLQVAPDFPEKVASVIDHTYPNKQVVQLISSQIDADRMDYLLRDSYFTGASYGEFDLTRILRVIRPIENGIAFQRNGMPPSKTTSSVATRCTCRFISTPQHAPWKFSYRIFSNAPRNSILKTRTSLHELLHTSCLSLKKM
ncbi:dGTP triphosphohydrolase [Streptococcus pneumoniae]|nr:dGTP triphosphohydrolase [Streptococcus pneumoniae]